MHFRIPISCPGYPELWVFFTEATVRNDAEWLIGFINSELGKGVRYKNGEYIQIGWMQCKISPCLDGGLCLMEPDMKSFPIHFIPSVDSTLMDLRLQESVVQSYRGVDSHFPSILNSAIMCVDVTDQKLMITRTDSIGNDSGWFFGCQNEAHDHNMSDNIRCVSLYEAALLIPPFVQFLALPPGIQLLCDKGRDVRASLYGSPLAPLPGSFMSKL